MSEDAVTWEEFNAIATNSVVGTRCWLAWLGYGNVLFLHFGENYIEPTEKDPFGGFYPPDYAAQLMVDFADWELRQGVSIVTARLHPLEESIEVIKGLAVLGLTATRQGDSILTFEHDYRIKITPWSKKKYALSDAWSVRDEENYYFAVTCSGYTYKIHGDTPIYGDVSNQAPPLN